VTLTFKRVKGVAGWSYPDQSPGSTTGPPV
jgi:hypothetical protein